MTTRPAFYPAFFDDSETKTAGLASNLWRRFGTRVGFGVANSGLGAVGGSMVDKMTGGDGTTGAMLGGALGAGTMRMNPVMAARITRTAAPKVLGLKGLDLLQRSRMGYSTFDPASVKTHMQDEMAKELEPIVAPWRGMGHPQVAPNMILGPGGRHMPGPVGPGAMPMDLGSRMSRFFQRIKSRFATPGNHLQNFDPQQRVMGNAQLIQQMQGAKPAIPGFFG